jgi:hypothetical protein
MQFLSLYSIFVFYFLWPLSQIFNVIKYFRLIAIMNLVHILLCSHYIYFTFEGGGGPNPPTGVQINCDTGVH